MYILYVNIFARTVLVYPLALCELPFPLGFSLGDESDDRVTWAMMEALSLSFSIHNFIERQRELIWVPLNGANLYPSKIFIDSLIFFPMISTLWA